jgi:hypothetical protein
MTQVRGDASVSDEVEPLSADDRAELERLRQENSALRAGARPPRRRIRWRSVIAVVLLFLGCTLAPVSLVAVWTHNQISDTDRFVETVAPLAADPSVQEALTTRITTTVFQYVDVEALANEAIDALAAQGLRPELAQRMHGLTPTLATAVNGLVRDKVAQLVASPQFASAWDQAVRVAHQQAIIVLSGNSQTIVVQGDTVYLDLAPFIDVAKQRLSAEGLTIVDRIPEVHPTIALAPADQLVRAQTAYNMLDSLASVLPWITLLLLAVGIYLARNRMRALVGTGLGVATSLLVLAAGLLVARGLLVGAVPPAGAPAAAAGFDIVVRFLRDSGRALMVLALVVALGGFLAGSSDTAVVVRRRFASLVDNIRGGPSATGPVATWVRPHMRGLRIGAVALAVLVFVFLERPTGAAILLIATGLLVMLAVIEFLGRPGAPATGQPSV